MSLRPHDRQRSCGRPVFGIWRRRSSRRRGSGSRIKSISPSRSFYQPTCFVFLLRLYFVGGEWSAAKLLGTPSLGTPTLGTPSPLGSTLSQAMSRRPVGQHGYQASNADCAAQQQDGLESTKLPIGAKTDEQEYYSGQPICQPQYDRQSKLLRQHAIHPRIQQTDDAARDDSGKQTCRS